MSDASDDANVPRIRRGDELEADEKARLLTHGLHEENIFYNRLNFFMVCESLLFAAAVSVMSGSNTMRNWIVVPICILGFIVSVLWLYVQIDKLVLLQTLEARSEEAFREFKESLDLADQRRVRWFHKRHPPATSSEPDSKASRSVSGVLAWTFPSLFALAWVYLGLTTLVVR